MRASHSTLSGLLPANIQYRVPIYQRRYEWGREQYRTLWQDVLDTLKCRQNARSKTYRHFFGILVRRDEDVQGQFHCYDLIDGQQRLITASILAKAVRDTYQERLGQSGGRVHPCVQTVDDILFNAQISSTASERGKLLPSELDRQAYSAIMGLILDPDQSPSSIRDAYRFFYKAVSRYLEGVTEDSLGLKANDIITTIAEGFAVAVVTMTGAENDYQVFESLNGKGLPLSESDKVRNLCFMRIDALGEEQTRLFYDSHWYPMEIATKSPSTKRGRPARSLDKFMCHWTRMRTGKVFPDRKLYGTIRDFVLQCLSETHDNEDPAQRVLEIFLEMTSYANAYRVAEWPNECINLCGDDALVDRLGILKETLGVLQSAHPFLLCVLKRYLNESPKNEQALDAIFGILERYLVRRSICGLGTKAQMSIFQSMGFELYGEPISSLDDVVPWLENWLKEQTKGRRWPDDIEFAQKFRQYNVEVDRIGPLLPFLFCRIESALTSKPLAEMKDARLVKASNSCGNASNIGNFILIDALDAAAEISSSRYATTRECAESTWDKAAIKGRAERLCNNAIALWPHPDSTDISPSQAAQAYEASAVHGQAKATAMEYRSDADLSAQSLGVAPESNQLVTSPERQQAYGSGKHSAKDVQKHGNSINGLRFEINNLYSRVHRTPAFKPSVEGERITGQLAAFIVTGESTFKDWIDMMYKHFYEASGGAIAGPPLVDRTAECGKVRWHINKLRNGFFHDSAHSEDPVTEQETQRRLYMHFIGKPYPTQQREWTSLQLSIMYQTVEWLQHVANELRK